MIELLTPYNRSLKSNNIEYVDINCVNITNLFIS